MKVIPLFCPTIADSITKIVPIDAPTAPIRMPAVDVAKNDQRVLQARNFGSNYLWTPGTNLSSNAISNPTITTSIQQEYLIQIGVPSGCSTTDTLLVRVHDANSVFLPTVFSPNGDGLNDKLFINYVGIKSLKKFQIFNRWGKKIFETNNLFDAWDGTLYGVKQPMDSYTWVIEAIDLKGNIIAKQGTITLLR